VRLARRALQQQLAPMVAGASSRQAPSHKLSSCVRTTTHAHRHELNPQQRVVAVGDVHGDADAFEQQLVAGGLIAKVGGPWVSTRLLITCPLLLWLLAAKCSVCPPPSHLHLHACMHPLKVGGDTVMVQIGDILDRGVGEVRYPC
jgi:hypothetical protein